MSFWDDLKDLGESVTDFAGDIKDDVSMKVGWHLGDIVRNISDATEKPRNIAKAVVSTSPVYQATQDLFSDSVTPVRGSVLYVDLAFGHIEHSGIYIGNNKIVELNSRGVVSIVSPREFVSGGTGRKIYVSCYEDEPRGYEGSAVYAESLVGEVFDYNIAVENCHRFTMRCLYETQNRDEVTLTSLKKECFKLLDVNEWRHWDIT